MDCMEDDLLIFSRTIGGYDAGIICHTRLATVSIMKARIPSRAQSIRNRYEYINIEEKLVGQNKYLYCLLLKN